MGIVYIASDHAGVEVKEKIKRILNEEGYQYKDFGPESKNTVVDYPDYAKKVSEYVGNFNDAKGILICGSGTGMQIAANKFSGVRAAFAYDMYSAEMARRDNDANILTLRARNFDESLYKPIVKTFLLTPFSGESRHKNRIEKIASFEKN